MKKLKLTPLSATHDNRNNWERKEMQAESKQVIAEAKPVKKTKYERIRAFFKF